VSTPAASIPTACPAAVTAPATLSTRPRTAAGACSCRLVVSPVNSTNPGAPTTTNSTTYTGSARVTAGPFQVINATTPNTAADPAVNQPAPDRPDRPDRPVPTHPGSSMTRRFSRMAVPF
jgi:hypothetical protein